MIEIKLEKLNEYKVFNSACKGCKNTKKIHLVIATSRTKAKEIFSGEFPGRHVSCVILYKR